MQARQLLQARDEIRSARAPEPGLNWERLRPSDDLNFTSNSWSIALDRKTGASESLRVLPSLFDVTSCARRLQLGLSTISKTAACLDAMLRRV